MSEPGVMSLQIHTQVLQVVLNNPPDLSLHAPFHSVLPQGFLIRMRGMVSFLKKASSPWPKRTRFTAVTAYAWPFTSPFAILNSISCGSACEIKNKNILVLLSCKEANMQKQHQPWWSSWWFPLDRTLWAGLHTACLVFPGLCRMPPSPGRWLRTQRHWNLPRHLQCSPPPGIGSSLKV